MAIRIEDISVGDILKFRGNFGDAHQQLGTVTATGWHKGYPVVDLSVGSKHVDTWAYLHQIDGIYA